MDHHILALHHLVEDLNNLVVLAVDLVMELLIRFRKHTSNNTTTRTKWWTRNPNHRRRWRWSWC